MTPEEKKRYEDLSLQADLIRSKMRDYREELRDIRAEMARIRNDSAERRLGRHIERYMSAREP